MNPSIWIAEYRQGITRLRQVMERVPPECLAAHPIPGTWSILEILCHLADSEALFAERMKRVLAEDRPALAFADPSRYCTALVYAQRDATEELAAIGSIRQQMARILDAQPSEAWERIGMHSTEGERTLAQLLRKAVDHFAHHLGFLEAKLAQMTV